MRAENIAMTVFALTFAIMIVNQVDEGYAMEYEGRHLFLNRVNPGNYTYNMNDENLNHTISEYGFNKAPSGILESFDAAVVGLMGAVKFIIDFIFNATIGFGAFIINTFFPSLNNNWGLSMALKSAIGGFVFINDMLYLIYIIRGYNPA